MLDSDHDNLTMLEWNLEEKFLRRRDWPRRARFLDDLLRFPPPAVQQRRCRGQRHHFSARLGARFFRKYKVDIYLCGHEHNLQHLEIANFKTSLVLAGGGGAHSYPLIRDNRGPFSRAIYGFVHFEFTPEQVIVHYIDADGKPVHVFVRTKAGEVKTVLTTPSDSGVGKPLEAIQGLYDKLHPATRPASAPATQPVP